MKTAVVGCGMISEIYLSNLTKRFPDIEVAACCAATMESARRRADQFGIRACTLEEILKDQSIELIVNLTPPLVHAAIIRQALEAGKHVYTEKPLATSYPEARQLAQLADSKGLYLGVAPDTFLGDALQTAQAAVQAGAIGEVTGCSISLNRRMEHFYEFLTFTRQPGGGMGQDIGPYYFTAALSLLGPVRRVCGMTATTHPERVNRREGSEEYGKAYQVENENQFAAVLQFQSGVLGTVYLNGDSIFPEMPHFAIYGTKGILHLPNPDEFGGEVRLLLPSACGSGIVSWKRLQGTGRFSDNSRGVGVAEMAEAIRAGRGNRASKEMGVHLLEILDAVYGAGGKTVTLESTFQPPQPMAEWEPWMG